MEIFVFGIGQYFQNRKRQFFEISSSDTLIGFLVLLLIHVYLVMRMGLREIYDNRFIFFVVLMGIVLMFGITLLYKFDVERYVVFGVYMVFIGVLGYRYREMVKSIFKKKTVG